MGKQDDETGARARFKLISGGKIDEVRVGAVEIVYSSPGRVEGNVEAQVVEDDTFFVLGAGTEICEPVDHPLRVLNELQSLEEAEPGTLRVTDGPPLKIHAVVHDLAADPTWREAWVEAALDATFDEVERRGLKRIAMPVLGAVHGRLTIDRFRSLLARSLEKGAPKKLVRIWVTSDD